MSHSPRLPLRGRRFLVTRPEGQATGLMEGIRALGGTATHIPLLAIEALPESPALAQIADNLAAYRAVIFISANAVRIAWPTLTRNAKLVWPSDVAAATVGPGTTRELEARGVSHVVTPARRFDSEGLLSEPFFAENLCRDQRFALIRGEGGRDLLAQTLRARGAHIDEIAVYQRGLHPLAFHQLRSWVNEDPTPAMLLISSSESLERTMLAASDDLATTLRAIPVLVPHPRIAESARRLGFERVVVSEGGDEGMLAYLQTYNENNLA